jgi:hypothetical protein
MPHPERRTSVLARADQLRAVVEWNGGTERLCFLLVRKLLVLGAVVIAGCGSAVARVTKTVTAPSPTGSSTARTATSGPGRSVEMFRVPAQTMLPTLHIGQVVTVSLDPSYVPKIGDIVVFHPRLLDYSDLRQLQPGDRAFAGLRCPHATGVIAAENQACRCRPR